MAEVTIQQALYCRHQGGGRILARSAGFHEDWLPEVERMSNSFGARPPGLACPPCVFARPFGVKQVAVVQVGDLGADGAGSPDMLGFHFLILPQLQFRKLGGDPFALAERLPPPWDARGELPALSLPASSPPQRTVAQVQEILKRGNRSPLLLGGVQALVDGGRLVFERTSPDTGLVRDLWTLLPTGARCHLWPASYAFGNELGFDVLVVPRASGDEYASYLSEVQAGDYPEGHYELGLQIAAEAADQRALDSLFSRRSRGEIWRMGLTLFAVISVLVIVGKWLTPPGVRRDRPAESTKLVLPPGHEFAALKKEDEQKLTQALRDLAIETGIKPLPSPPTADRLIAEFSDRKLKTDRTRRPGTDITIGPPERRLRALLWQYGIADYGDRQLSPLELVDRLREKLAEPKQEEKKRRER